MKIGLFFGSFNPIHSGHMIIAQYMVEETDLERIWFVVSPQNPLKNQKSLAHEQDRYDMVQAAVYDNYNFQVTDIEFHMPRPSYTIDTLTWLSEKYPEHEFVVIMGADNLNHIEKWKNHQVLLDNYELYVYPRPGSSIEKIEIKGKVKYIEAPLISISATEIRRMVSRGKSVKYLVPDAVEALIKSKKLYLQ
ncbi:MAG: nicotinate (nicotinamide) nucleotide adenylyltransferase [Cyclobacteriaceae bacterium]|nr:nicotinate (nicotinamide) nucleotide adenylyltransferase [Cyclobacteriaceae bacterium]